MSQEFNKNDILSRFQNKGLLVTLNSTGFYCPGFNEQVGCGENDKNNACMDVDKCDVTDLGNVKHLLNYNLTDVQTLCYAIDTTYLHQSIPPIVFGPMLNYDSTGSSFPIGLILDMNVLKPYIGCAYSFDAGSIGRTPPDAVPDIMSEDTAKACKESAKNMTNDRVLKGELHKNLKQGSISPDNCPAVVMAGCLNFDGTYKPASKIYNPRDKVSNNGVIQNCADNKNELCYNSWSFSNSEVNPFFEGTDQGLELFKKQVVPIQKILGAQSRNVNADDIRNFYNKHSSETAFGDYFSYQIPASQFGEIGWDSGDGYRETEVDIFVPQEPNTDVTEGCNPDKEFIKVWRKAIIGVFTNNLCFQDVRHSNLKNIPEKCKKNCCQDDFNEQLAIKLAKKYNENGPNKIHAYRINTVRPDTKAPRPNRIKRDMLIASIVLLCISIAILVVLRNKYALIPVILFIILFIVSFFVGKEKYDLSITQLD